MPRALIIGGTGLVGRAAARRLLDAGWSVEVTGRDASHFPSAIAEATFTAADRDDTSALRRALGGGVDLLVDCVCYTAAQARLLLPLMADVGSSVMISSKAVYVDDHGNHTNSPVPPHFDGPVAETQPTMTAGDGDFQTREGYGVTRSPPRMCCSTAAPGSPCYARPKSTGPADSGHASGCSLSGYSTGARRCSG